MAKNWKKNILFLKEVWEANLSEAAVICLWIFYKQKEKRNFPEKWLTVNYSLSAILPPL